MLRIGLCSTVRVAIQVDWPRGGSHRGDASFVGLLEVLRTSKELVWHAVLRHSLYARFVQWDVCEDRADLAARANEGHVILTIDHQQLRLAHLFNTTRKQDDEALLQLRRFGRQRFRQLFWSSLR